MWSICPGNRFHDIVCPFWRKGESSAGAPGLKEEDMRPGIRPRSVRLVAYLRGLGWALALILVAFGVLAFVQAYWHPFDLVIEAADARLATMDRTLSADAVAGVSIGTLALVVAVAAVPLFRRGVRRRQYIVSFWRGLLSSAIFLATDRLYRYVQSLSLLYFTATLALFIGITIVLVEIVSRLGSFEQEAERRTEFLASIVSGLVFGLLVQLAEYGLGWIRGLAG